MKDYIVSATAAGGYVRAFAADTKEMVGEAARRHNTSPVATAALGRMLTAAAIMATTLKGEKDLITLQVRGDGPLGGIVATSDSLLRTKGYVFNPNVELMEQYKGKLDVGRAVGKGYLSVSMDIGLKEPYSGQIELISGEIAEDLTYYFAVSQQTPSSVGLGVLVDVDYSVRSAGGFIIQLMPDAPEEAIAALERNIAAAPYMSDLLDMGHTPETVLDMLLKGLEPNITDKRETEFFCGCSKERVEKALISIGGDELKSLADDGKGAQMHCHFCNTSYDFTDLEVKQLLESAVEK